MFKWQVKEFFEIYGNIQRITVAPDCYGTSNNRLYAIIIYYSQASAKEAIQDSTRKRFKFGKYRINVSMIRLCDLSFTIY